MKKVRLEVGDLISFNMKADFIRTMKFYDNIIPDKKYKITEVVHSSDASVKICVEGLNIPDINFSNPLYPNRSTGDSISLIYCGRSVIQEEMDI